MMVLSAFTAYAGALILGNLWAGLVIGILTGVTMSLVLVGMCVRLPLSQLVVGFALYIAGLGLSSFLNDEKLIPGGLQRVQGFPAIGIPYLQNIPIIGPILFSQNILTYIGLLLVPLSYFILTRTSIGLTIKSVGENPGAARSLGLGVLKTRTLCVIFGGAMAGFGGAFLTLGYVNFFSDGMTAGTGWIALAIVILGSWSPFRVLVGALLFGISESLGLYVQAIGSGIPSSLTAMFPYILTVVVLSLVALRRSGRGPAALGKPFLKEER